MTDVNRDRSDEQGTADTVPDEQQVGRGKKNVSNKPLPELSERGGVEPVERTPAEYNDRTRDHELDEG
jgi:hypothetical protein